MSKPSPNSQSNCAHSPRIRQRGRRRCALALAGLLAAGSLLTPFAGAAHAASATKETLNQLSSAEQQLAEVQQQLEAIAQDYEALAKEQAQTIEQIDDVEEDIGTVEGQIEDRTEELHQKQGALSDRVATNYKSGSNRSLLALVLSSTNFSELTSNIYYANKVTANDVALVNDVRAVKQALEDDRRELESRQEELEGLRDEQQARLEEQQAKQEEAEQTVANLSKEVKDLMNKRDAELAASIEAEARQREAQAQNARPQPGSGSSGNAEGSSESSGGESQNQGSGESQNSGGSSEGSGGSESSSGGSSESEGGSESSGAPSNAPSGKGAAVVAACQTTGSPGGGLCAMWVSQVYQKALGYYPGGNANDMYLRCTSSDLSDLEPGMAVAVSTHPHTTAGQTYGHIGIYIGDGLIMDNIGYIRTMSVYDWIDYYSVTVPARWGWV